MKEPNAPSRYGEALLNVAEKRNVVQEVLDGSRAVVKIVEQQRELLTFLNIPQVSASQKKAVLRNALEGQIPSVLLDFLYLLVDRRRADGLLEIFEAFEHAYEKRQDIHPVDVTTASEMPEDLRQKLEKKLQEVSGGNVRVTYKVNETLLGGVLLLWGDTGTDIDGTIRRQLGQIKERLSKAKVY